MLLYNIRVAVKSLRRSPVLSLLLLFAIALGTGVSTTFAAVHHAFARDPIPSKSEVLRFVRVDNWDPLGPPYGKTEGGLPPHISYFDMVRLMRSPIPVRQTGMYSVQPYVFPPPETGIRPLKENGRACTADFFAMFEAPFRFGGPWTRAQDEARERVVVLGEILNDKLFGGVDSVGKTIRLDEQDYRIVGVLSHWDPGVKFFDVTQGASNPIEQLFLPLETAVAGGMQNVGNNDSWRSGDNLGLAALVANDAAVFIGLWVELPNAQAQRAYQDWIDGYVLDQQKHGRLLRPLNNTVESIAEVFTRNKVVPEQATAMMIISLLFLAVCCVNLIGILLSKFLARASEIGVRRALGASRMDVFLQHVVECELLGVAGGVAGLLLAIGGVAAMNAYMKLSGGRADFIHLDAPMLAFSAALALLSGLVAGAYPAYRVCKVAPALHLKAS